jgi:hypothetical protein
MRTEPFRDEAGEVVHPSWLVKYEGNRGPYANPANNDAPPDLTDPATVGCLLALVRDAWGDPKLYVGWYYMPDGSWQWCVMTIAYGGGPVSAADSEAEALVCALEAAGAATLSPPVTTRPEVSDGAVVQTGGGYPNGKETP